MIEEQSSCQKQVMIKDSSQIQLKYAKILEELENASCNKVVIGEGKPSENNEELDAEASYNDALCTPQKIDNSMQSYTNIEEESASQNQKKRSYSSGCPRHYHLKNKKSSQYEQKQFYEQELHQLKNELEQFTKEEEKLLSIL